MSPLTRRATLRHIQVIERRKPWRRVLSRINPMMVVGALLAGALLVHLGSSAKPMECRNVRSVQV